MKNIAVFYGGVSVESEVSVITGVLTANTLRKKDFNVIPVYVNGDGEWFTGEYLFDPDNYAEFDKSKVKRVSIIGGSNALFQIKGKKVKELFPISCAINCMHGERGEDGSLAGLLNMCNIPLVSPPLLSSAVSMDKRFTKIVLKGLKVKALPSVTVGSTAELDKLKLNFTYPVIVKPVCGGSSIGVNTANDLKRLSECVAYALRFGERAIIEPCLNDFTEINCAVYACDGKIFTSECERPIGKTEILSFADKYQGGGREFPANLDESVSLRIKKISERVYADLGFSGIIRIDYFVYGEEIYLNEINSVPGSLAYYLFCNTTAEFGNLLENLIKDGIKRASARDTFQKKFKSGILSSVGAKSSKRL